jgi:hypothetical protein
VQHCFVPSGGNLKHHTPAQLAANLNCSVEVPLRVTNEITRRVCAGSRPEEFVKNACFASGSNLEDQSPGAQTTGNSVCVRSAK